MLVLDANIPIRAVLGGAECWADIVAATKPSRTSRDKLQVIVVVYRSVYEQEPERFRFVDHNAASILRNEPIGWIILRVCDEVDFRRFAVKEDTISRFNPLSLSIEKRHFGS